MVRLKVKHLKKGMIVAQSIYNKMGASYLVKGQPITQSYINQLKKIGIPAVSVTSTDPSFQLPPPEDIIQERTRVTAINRVYTAFQDVATNGAVDLDKMKDISEKILFDVIDMRDNLVQLTDIRLHDTYTFAHSVNVAVLSTMIGTLCHETKENLMLITVGGLLHDLGKINVDEKILNKNTRLDDTEFEAIRSHPTFGAKRILDMGHGTDTARTLAAIAWQHHEHLDGTGYPRHLTEDKIHRFAKIAAIADVYDALTSVRPYKKSYAPNLAYHIMKTVNKGQFDEKLLSLFFNNVAIYPVGTILKTIWGYGIVSKCTFGKTETPRFILFASSDGKILPKEEEIDLSERKEGSSAILQVVGDQDLRHFIHEISFDPARYLKGSVKKPAEAETA